jgi:hypothetical protein
MTYRGSLLNLFATSAVLHAGAAVCEPIDYAADGERFYRSCQTDRHACERFVSNLSQARQDAQASGMIPNRYCPPRRMNVKALTNTVLIYISAMPDRKNRPLGAIAGEAFDSRFPCRQPGAATGGLGPQL